MKVSTKFEVDTTICCLVIALLLLIHCDFDLWYWPVVYIAGQAVNPYTKFEDPMATCSWVVSSDISHRIPLTMRLQPLRMRRITWPMRRGQTFPAYLKSLTPISLFNIQFYSATIKTNGVVRQNGALAIWQHLRQLIFSHIFTAHAQERLFMNFRLRFWHQHSIPWSRLPYRAR